MVEEREHSFGLVAKGVPHEGDCAGGNVAGEGAVDALIAEVDPTCHLRDDGDAVIE